MNLHKKIKKIINNNHHHHNNLYFETKSRHQNDYFGRYLGK